MRFQKPNLLYPSMVNHGVSRACLTCKTRKIRCDEGRPTCKRCTNSRRTCLGYEGEAATIPQGSAPKFAESKCAVAERKRPPRSSPPSNRLGVERDPKVRAAFNTFFSNFVIVPRDRSLSRGYLDGLEDLLATAGQGSEVVRATRIVALASAANTSGSHDLLHRAQTEYADTLLAFKKLLHDATRCHTDEALMTAALLGLYEMMVATEPYPNAHSAHIRGVSAILCTRNLNLDLLPGVRLFRCFKSFVSSSLPLDVRTHDLPSSQPSSIAEPFTQNLDVLMLQLRKLLQRGSKILSDPEASKAALGSLKQQASLLNKEFYLWPLCLPKEWAPQTLGILKKTIHSTDTDLENMPFWPGKVDSYFDLYVVAVWNTYREARLKLLQVVADCSERLRAANHSQERPLPLQKLQNEIQGLVDDLCASIPFHLIADLPCCLQSSGTIDNLHAPGKALGGLVLMYPLYVASILPLVPVDQRTWMKGRLRWIGKHMGIRQAIMLANVRLVRLSLYTL